MFDVRVSDEVATALSEGNAVVAMESTIFSHLGLPSPANEEALTRCESVVRAAGAVPAVTAVFGGEAQIGIDDASRERVCGPAKKMAERDIPVAIAQRWNFGATTVSAALALAERAGINVFATGGIGGVHRGSELTGDISADLDAIARRALVTVSAGAKAFLDLARTLEYLETAGAPVLGWKTDDFPAFYTRSSGLNVPHRVDSAEVVAAIYRNRTRNDQGLLLAVPIPESDALDVDHLDAVLTAALDECEAQGVRGAAITPFVLGRIAEATDGDSLPANLALAEHNAEVAAQVAVAICQAS